jgi:hypothetical protein
LSVVYGKLPRVATKDMLSDEDIAQLRAELAEGRNPTVWFTPAAVGMPAGKSAKVIAFTEPAEGDFIQVRPTGSQDEVSLSPSELTANRPPRPKRQPVRKTQEARDAQPTRPAPAPAEPSRTRVVSTPSAPALDAPQQRTASLANRPKTATGARKKPPAEVSVTLNSTQEGEWTVEVVVGKRRAVRPTPVAATAVAKAARELPEEVTEAIDAVLEAARQLQQERIERLQAELEAAQRTLDDLSE